MPAMPAIRARSTKQSACPAARDYSRAYLHHLIKATRCWARCCCPTINLAYYQELMAGMRDGDRRGRIRRLSAPRRSEAGRGATFRRTKLARQTHSTRVLDAKWNASKNNGELCAAARGDAHYGDQPEGQRRDPLGPMPSRTRRCSMCCATISSSTAPSSAAGSRNAAPARC